MFSVKKEKKGYQNLSNPGNRQTHQELHSLLGELFGGTAKKKPKK